MSKNPFDLLKEALVIIGSAAPYTWNAKESAAWSDRAAAFVKAHRDIKPEPALDGEWQSERPEEGEWWVSVRPEVRKYWLPHKGRVRVPVTVDALGVMNKGRRWDKDASVFTGALWQRRTVPGDPFAKGGG